MKILQLLTALLLALSFTEPGASAASGPPGKTSQSALTPDEQVNIRIYKATNKGVVNIAPVSSAEELMLDTMPQSGFGSGSIIRADGYIITNNHVVAGSKHVRVTLWDGANYPGVVVGTDPITDLAVVHIKVPETKKLTTIPFGNSSSLEVGRRVLAIGNPFGFDRTLTEGIISAQGRSITTETGRVMKGLLQTDAAINRGNSGGPLLDTQGRMVGINTMIIGPSGQWSGIGLAVPIDLARNIVPQLIDHGMVLRPELGIDVVTAGDVGLRVSRIVKGSPAYKAGLNGPKIVIYQWSGIQWSQLDWNAADVILAIDEKPVNSPDALMSYVESKKPNQVVTLTIIRGQRLMKIPVKLTVGNSN